MKYVPQCPYPHTNLNSPPFPFPRAPGHAQRAGMVDDSPLLALSNVRVTADEACILDLPALTIPAGESAAILGANGSGKSTLVKLIARQLYPAWGADVRIFGRTQSQDTRIPAEDLFPVIVVHAGKKQLNLV